MQLLQPGVMEREHVVQQVVAQQAARLLQGLLRDRAARHIRRRGDVQRRHRRVQRRHDGGNGV